jgi:hypothetical protein
MPGYGLGYSSLLRRSSGPSGPAYGALTTAWIAATGETDLTILGALNTLETDLTTYGLTSKMKALYPMVGGTAAKHKFNFMDARDLDAAYRLVFNGGWTHSSNGALPNGTNAYASTGIKVSDFAADSIGTGVYLRTNTDVLGADVGTFDTSRFQLLTRYAGAIYSGFPASNVTATGSTTDSRGLTSIGRVSTTSRKTFKNGSLVFTSSETLTSTVGINTYDFKIGASGGSSITWYSNKQNSLTAFKLAFTDTDEANFYTAVQAFQTTLSRQVI